MWTGDTLHGPVIASRKSSCSRSSTTTRAVMGARWAYHDDVVRMAAALRPALQRRGVPQAIYLDNGSPFVDAWLLRGCAVLGIRLIHSRPGKPEGRGKIERFFRTVRDQFLVEIGDGAGVKGLADMNRLFQAWVEASYHQAVHSETGEEPAARWARAARPSGRSRTRGGCGRRSCGRSGAGRPRLPWSPCTATPTRSTRGWPGSTSSWSSTRSTWTGSRSGSRGGPPGPPSRSPITSTATPRPASLKPGSGPSPSRPGIDLSRPRRQPRRGPERAGLLPVSHQQQAGAGKQGRRRKP